VSRVLFINRYYWPDEPATAQLLTDLAESLAAAGFEVEILTSMPLAEGARGVEQHNGVKINRLLHPAAKPRSLMGRCVLFAGFVTKAAFFCLRSLQRGDIVITMTDPPLLGLFLWPAIRCRRAGQLHWLQDVYPEIAMSVLGGKVQRRLLGFLLPVRNLTWRRSLGCVALGIDMAAHIRQASVPENRLHIIPNWSPRGVMPEPSLERDTLRRKLGLSSHFVVCYSGNLGRVHELGALIALAKGLRHLDRVRVLIIGDGAGRATLETEVLAESLENIQFLPPQPRAELSLTLSVADLHLITLRPDCSSLVFPSKFYGIAAAGKPMLFIGPKNCELAQLILEHSLGRAFATDDIPGMVGFISSLLLDPGHLKDCGANALSFSQTQGSLNQASKAWIALLGSLLKDSRQQNSSTNSR